MKAYLRHAGVASGHTSDGCLHIEQRCRVTLAPGPDKSLPDADAAQRQIVAFHESGVREWLAAQGYTLVEVRKDLTTVLGFGETVNV